eukprot:1146423-Pelagomonas_calceolata.AAC.8
MQPDDVRNLQGMYMPRWDEQCASWSVLAHLDPVECWHEKDGGFGARMCACVADPMLCAFDSCSGEHEHGLLRQEAIILCILMLTSLYDRCKEH